MSILPSVHPHPAVSTGPHPQPWPPGLPAAALACPAAACTLPHWDPRRLRCPAAASALRPPSPPLPAGSGSGSLAASTLSESAGKGGIPSQERALPS